MANSESTSRRYGCPSCGGGLRFDIGAGELLCEMCGRLTPVEDLPPEEGSAEMEVTEFHCPQCGAMVYSTDTEVTSFCSFCGSDVVLTGKMGRTRRPAQIVPFRVTRDQCEAAYRKHLKGYLLAPAAMKKTETVSHFRPVYVPFWSYDVNSKGMARLEGKKSYIQGKYQYDDTYDLTMDAEIRQKGILYDASTVFEDETAALLKHDAEGAKPFHPAYLSGIYAQGADVPGETYHAEAAASAVRRFMEKVRQDNDMDSVEMRGNIEENFGLPEASIREKLVMMPVWLLAHRQGARVVYTAINGQNGQVVCDLPVSNGKVIGVTAALAAGLFFLLQTALTMKPEVAMGLCALLTMIIQFLFSGSQKRLLARRNRVWEPDFTREGENEFNGPAQALLKRGKEGIATNEKKMSQNAGKAVRIALMVFVAVGYAVLSGRIHLGRLTSILSGSSTRKILVTFVVLAALATMVIHLIRKIISKDSGPGWPRALAVLACAAGAVSLISGQVEDMVFYACGAAMLAASLLELIMMNRAHNEYASRPVPFFSGEEASSQ